MRGLGRRAHAVAVVHSVRAPRSSLRRRRRVLDGALPPASPERRLTPARGAFVGAASGGFAFLFSAILIIAVLVYRADDLRRQWLTASPSFWPGYDPDKIQQTLELLKTPQGLSLFVGFVLFIMCVIFIVGASIGGAWYSAWVRKRLRR